jgi:iron-sulfur cluster assembly accessory protein
MSDAGQSLWFSDSGAKVVLTEKAAEIFKQSCREEGKELEDSFLRIDANPGGCSGYRYELDFNTAGDIKAEDEKFVSHGVNIVVDKTCLTEILGSVEIDYTDANMVEQGFVFQQLINGHQCGCGESFTAVKDLR